MAYKLHISNEDNIGEFAQVALQECLYENPNWVMKDLLEGILTGYPKSKLIIIISLIEVDNRFIGACLFTSASDTTVQTYIKPEYRRMGYGTILITKMISLVPDTYEVSTCEGIPESVLFFDKMVDLGLITKEQTYTFPVGL